MKVINSFLWECLAIIPSVLMAQTANKQPNIVLILADVMAVPIKHQTLTNFQK